MEINKLLENLTENRTFSGEDVAFKGWLHGPSSGSGSGNDITELPYLSLREEKWGGLLVHGPSMSVFSVDDAAYAILMRIKNGESLEDIEKSPPQGLTGDDIDQFSKLFHSLKIDGRS